MDDTIILQSLCKFRKIQWDSVVKDQIVFYHLNRKKPEEAHGPFVVVETGLTRLDSMKAIKLKNKQGFEFSFSEYAVQLLEFIEVF